jgi:hypothetical protein
MYKTQTDIVIQQFPILVNSCSIRVFISQFRWKMLFAPEFNSNDLINTASLDYTNSELILKELSFSF